MKIERLNENQIRCTLSQADLDQRELVLSELAYGSTKARELLHELIQQAARELDFEAENIPLMVEAIPIPNECLILVVTKVDDPENFNPDYSEIAKLLEALRDESEDQSIYDDEDEDGLPDFGMDPEEDEDGLSFQGMNEFDDPDKDIDLLAPFTKAVAEARKKAMKEAEEEADQQSQTHLFIFHDLDQIINLSGFLTPFYTGTSDLYKDRSLNEYYLFLHQADSSRSLYDRACMIASEYGSQVPAPYAATAYCREHCRLLFEETAIELLDKLN